MATSTAAGDGDSLFAHSAGPVRNSRRIPEPESDPQQPPPEPKNIPIHLKNIERWVDTIININNLSDLEGAELNREICQDWKCLSDIFKHCYADGGKTNAESAFILALDSLEKVKVICETRNKDR